MLLAVTMLEMIRLAVLALMTGNGPIAGKPCMCLVYVREMQDFNTA